MTGALLRVAGVAALGLVLLAGAVHAAPEESTQRIAVPDGNGGERPVLRISSLRGPQSRLGGGWGFFRVDLENEDRRDHDATVEVRVQNEVAAMRVVRVSKGKRARTWLPSPPGDNVHLEVRVGDAPPAPLWAARRDGLSEVALLSTTPRVPQMLERAAALRAGIAAPRRFCDFVPMAAEDLPPTWAWLTGASAVVLDGGLPGLEDAQRQRTLLDYVEAGGFLVLLRRKALPKGPLAEAIAAEDPGVGRRGLGGWIARDQEGLGENEAERVVEAWLASDGDAVGAAAAEVVPAELGLPARIPGLGTVPVRGFFFLLLLFAIVVGPVVYGVLRRRKRLTWLTVVVPAVGLGFAAAILAYGALSEGFGTRGVVRSLSILDQRTHDAVGVAGRTLYAGWGPSSLRLSPDTVLALGEEDRGSTPWTRRRDALGRARLRLDVDAGLLAGSVLPSRTVRSFVTSTQGRSRERLRFRRAKDGTHRVLPSQDFAPDYARGPVVLRDSDGGFHVGNGPEGAMDSVTAEVARRNVATALEAWTVRDPFEDEPDPAEQGLRVAIAYGVSPIPPRSPESLATWLARRLGPELPPGTYLAWFPRAPVFDDLGLEVDWESEAHLVVGVLAPDDVEEGP